jgi:hypothetical protein
MSNTATIYKPQNLMAVMASRFGVPEQEMLSTLKATAFWACAMTTTRCFYL